MSGAPRRLVAAAYAGVVGLAVVAFASSLGGGFVLDDVRLIVANRLIREPGHLAALLTTHYYAGFFGPDSHGLSYRPVTLLSFALDHAAWGLAPAGYHVVNLLLHAAVSCGLLVLARRLGLSLPAAFVVAALFAVHPLHTEAVSNVAGRSELLMALGSVGAWLAFLRAGGPGGISLRWMAVALGALALALGSKEQALIVPALLVPSDLVHHGPRWGAGRPRDGLRRAVSRHLPFVVVVGAYLLLRWDLLGRGLTGVRVASIDNPLIGAPAPVQVVTALGVAGRYLWLMLWPRWLSADYSYDAIPLTASPADPWLLVALAGWGGLLAAGVWGLVRRRPAASLGAALAVLSLLPVSNLLVSTGTIMGERLFYLPSAGVLLVLGAVVDAARDGARRRGWRGRRLALAGAGTTAVVLVALTARTIARNVDWSTSDRLYLATVRVVPRSVKAQLFHGVLLRRQGRSAEAAGAFERALAVSPDLAEAWLGLGQAREQGRDWPRARQAYGQAVALYEQTLPAVSPGLGEGLASLGRVDLAEGSADAMARAEPLLLRALGVQRQTLGPGHPAVARTLATLAVLYADQQREAEAIATLDQALATETRTPPAAGPVVGPLVQDLVVVRTAQGRTEEAERIRRLLAGVSVRPRP